MPYDPPSQAAWRTRRPASRRTRSPTRQEPRLRNGQLLLLQPGRGHFRGSCFEVPEDAPGGQPARPVDHLPRRTTEKAASSTWSTPRRPVDAANADIPVRRSYRDALTDHETQSRPATSLPPGGLHASGTVSTRDTLDRTRARLRLGDRRRGSGPARATAGPMELRPLWHSASIACRPARWSKPRLAASGWRTSNWLAGLRSRRFGWRRSRSCRPSRPRGSAALALYPDARAPVAAQAPRSLGRAERRGDRPRTAPGCRWSGWNPQDHAPQPVAAVVWLGACWGVAALVGVLRMRLEYAVAPRPGSRAPVHRENKPGRARRSRQLVAAADDAAHRRLRSRFDRAAERLPARQRAHRSRRSDPGDERHPDHRRCCSSTRTSRRAGSACSN